MVVVEVSLSKNNLDKYYTKPAIADMCIAAMLPYTTGCKMFIEPSAGAGAFCKDFTTHAFDLEPDSEGITQADWLLVDSAQFSQACVYGNPPFGKRNSLSKAFIKKSCEFADVIAFVLPAVYNKHTLQKVFPSCTWKLVETIPLPHDSFTEGADSYHIPSVFQVWKKGYTGACKRAVERKTFTNNHFSIVAKQEADLFVMGAAPNTVKLPCEVTVNNRGYWLKCHIPVVEVADKFRAISWVGNSSASGGVAWHTKTEIMNTYEENTHGSK